MKKLIGNQMLYRLRTSKYLLILFMVLICLCFVSLPTNVSYQYITKESQIHDLLYTNTTLDALIITLFILFVLQFLRMYQGYKHATIRWSLLTKKKSAYMIGDTLFLTLVILILLLIHYACVYYNLSHIINALGSKKTHGVSPFYVMQHTSELALFYPTTLVHQLRNLMLCLLSSSMLCCTVCYFIKEKRHFMDIILLVCGLLLMVIGISYIHPWMQIVLYAILSAFFLWEGTQRWYMLGKEDIIC